MAASQSRRFNARVELFSVVRAFIEQFCAASGANSGTATALTLIVEELFANSAQHGYHPSQPCAPDWPVWLTLGVTGDGIDAVYEDDAPEYNPFVKVAAPDYSGPADTWRVGGLGVVLVAGHASHLDYQRRSGRNSIRFMVPLEKHS